MEPTDMGCVIWQGMRLSGPETGMVSMHRLRRLTGEGLVRDRTACFAVAVGSTTSVRGTAVLKTAESSSLTTTTSLAAGETSTDSVLFCPQVNRRWSRCKSPAVASTSAVHPPTSKADGTLGLEIRAPQGTTGAVETTSDLSAWTETQRITGQGAGSPVKVTLFSLFSLTPTFKVSVLARANQVRISVCC